jgi:putative methyltransferase (TIGR04325 family)
MLSLRKILRRFQSKESQQPTSPIFEGSQLEVFSGDYATWDDAKKNCSGYDSQHIFDKAKISALAVRDGRAIFERDTVLFQEEEFCWETLGCLMHVAATNNGCLRVLDFGGSLGTFYFQHKKFLKGLPSLCWSVVEQAHFVEFGASQLQDGVLRFSASLSEACRDGVPEVIYFGSVLEYLAKPFSLLEEVFSCGVKNIIIDRTGFLEGSLDRLTIQNVPPHIYEASYPAWFFSRSKFKALMLASGFNLNAEWVCKDEYSLDGAETSFRGFYYSKK